MKGKWIGEFLQIILFLLKKEETTNITKSLTPNAIQVDWCTPSKYPCCPQELSGNPLGAYHANLKVGSIFCRNDIYSSLILDSALTDNQKSLWVMTENLDWSIKPWALAKVTYKYGVYVHENQGTFFDKKGAEKYFTLAQEKEWTGEDVIDDFC